MRIQLALAQAAKQTGRPEPMLPEPGDGSPHLPRGTWKSESPAEKQALVAQLIQAGQAANLSVHPVADAAAASHGILRLVMAQGAPESLPKTVVAWDHPLIRDLGLAEALGACNVPLTYVPQMRSAPHDLSSQARANLIRDLESASLGVTAADYCTADTATLVLKSRPGQARSVSLLPAIHAAVIRADQILPDWNALMERLQDDHRHAPEKWTNCLTLISGPSKTADIEATLVLGAHGPRQVHIFVIAPTSCS